MANKSLNAEVKGLGHLFLTVEFQLIDVERNRKIAHDYRKASQECVDLPVDAIIRQT